MYSLEVCCSFLSSKKFSWILFIVAVEMKWLDTRRYYYFAMKTFLQQEYASLYKKEKQLHCFIVLWVVDSYINSKVDNSYINSKVDKGLVSYCCNRQESVYFRRVCNPMGNILQVKQVYSVWMSKINSKESILYKNSFTKLPNILVYLRESIHILWRSPFLLLSNSLKKCYLYWYFKVE